MNRVIFILIFLFISVNIFADDNFREKEINFIKELYKGGRYFDCIAETRRLQFNEKTSSTEYFIYSNYFLAGQYASVISNYNADLSSDEMQFYSRLLLSGSFMKKGMYFESYKILKNQGYEKLTGENIFTMFLRRVEPLILSGESAEIDEEIAGAGIFLKDSYKFIKLQEELLSYKEESLKSPLYAAAMSAIVPGLGQAYAGNPADGLISLLSVAVTAAGGLYMKENGRKSFSYTMFFFSGLFYGGNVYGAYNSAVSANNYMLQRRYNSVISQYGSYSPGDYIDLERVFN